MGVGHGKLMADGNRSRQALGKWQVHGLQQGKGLQIEICQSKLVACKQKRVTASSWQTKIGRSKLMP
eukprot:843643-Pelagomonas_calceolata.AAC.7